MSLPRRKIQGSIHWTVLQTLPLVRLGRYPRNQTVLLISDAVPAVLNTIVNRWYLYLYSRDHETTRTCFIIKYMFRFPADKTRGDESTRARRGGSRTELKANVRQRVTNLRDSEMNRRLLEMRFSWKRLPTAILRKFPAGS